mmetsp:Transcript_7463/g.13516  ORF Transcript_7463/g.13516 Transcript_7463/m.13516 type:complete len:789 (-) Transcript_7463:574-2940(-)
MTNLQQCIDAIKRIATDLDTRDPKDDLAALLELVQQAIKENKARKKCVKKCNSDQLGGAVPDVWSQDLQPHLEILAQDKEEVALPPDGMVLSLREAHHLVLVIHGIGKHDDFLNDWDVNGGYFDFKANFSKILGTKGALAGLPISVHFETIEWHQALREECNIEQVLNDAAPDGVQTIREFLTSTLVDGMLYQGVTFAQKILDNVVAQLNFKYNSFLASHPGFNGPVSIFAHSLGSLITFDILTKTRTDVVTPPLDFDVNIFYSAGSPLAYLYLSRGDMFDPTTGEYEVQNFLPKNVRFVNLFHQNDPVAWRVGPLLTKQPSNDVNLPQTSNLENKQLTEILFQFARLDSAQDTFDEAPRPIDMCLPLTRYDRMSEFASSLQAHSSYWSSESVVLGVILTLCEPLYPILLGYEKMGLQIRVVPRQTTLDPEQPAHVIETVMLEGPVKGFWKERLAILQPDSICMAEQPPGGANQLKGWLALSSATSSVTWVDGNQANREFQLVHRATTYSFKAPSHLDADQWVTALAQACQNGKADQPAEQFAQTNKALFNHSKSGMLNLRTGTTWPTSSSNSWFALEREFNVLTWYDAPPVFDVERRVELADINLIQCSTSERLFRLIYTGGGSLVFRAKTDASLETWATQLEPVCPDATFESALVPQEADQQPTRLHNTRNAVVTSYVISQSKQGKPYANFVISVNFVFETGQLTNYSVLRRYSEIKNLHKALVKELGPENQLPPVPKTSFIPSLDETYLNRKVQILNGYMQNSDPLQLTTGTTINRMAKISSREN